MKLEVNIDKRYFFIFLAIGLIIVGIVGVIAYVSPPDWTKYPSDFGHSVNEIDWGQTIQGNVNVTGNVSAAMVCINGVCKGVWPTGGGGSQWQNQTGTNNIYYNLTGGNVGIGTATPSQKLEIDTGGLTGGIKITGTVGDATLWLTRTSGSEPRSWSIRTSPGAYDGGFYIRDVTQNADRLYISTGGNVGIGTTNPQTKLDVNGNVNINGTIAFVVGGRKIEAQVVTGTEDTSTSFTTCYPGWVEDTCNHDNMYPYTCDPLEEGDCTDNVNAGRCGSNPGGGPVASGYSNFRTVKCKFAWNFVRT